MKYSLTVLFFIIFPLQFYSQDKAESSEMLSVLTVFLDDFKKNQISKPVEIRILKEKIEWQQNNKHNKNKNIYDKTSTLITMKILPSFSLTN